MKKQAVAGGEQMARHRTSHRSEAYESDIDHSLVSLGVEGQRGVPAETVDRRRPRLVFASDPAAVAERIEMPEQEGIVDLAGTGLVAPGIVGKLDMGDPSEMFLQAARDVTLHHLHV